MVNIKTSRLYPPGWGKPPSPLEASWGKASGVGGKHKPVRPESGRIVRLLVIVDVFLFLVMEGNLKKSENLVPYSAVFRHTY